MGSIVSHVPTSYNTVWCAVAQRRNSFCTARTAVRRMQREWAIPWVLSHLFSCDPHNIIVHKAGRFLLLIALRMWDVVAKVDIYVTAVPLRPWSSQCYGSYWCIPSNGDSYSILGLCLPLGAHPFSMAAWVFVPQWYSHSKGNVLGCACNRGSLRGTEKDSIVMFLHVLQTPVHWGRSAKCPLGDAVYCFPSQGIMVTCLTWDVFF